MPRDMRGLDFVTYPEWRWPAAKLGLPMDSVFTTLDQRYNTFSISLQEPASFHADVASIATDSSTADEFHRRLAERGDQRRAELTSALTSIACRAAQSDALLAALDFFHNESLDTLIMFLASLLPKDAEDVGLSSNSDTTTTNTAPVTKQQPATEPEGPLTPDSHLAGDDGSPPPELTFSPSACDSPRSESSHNHSGHEHSSTDDDTGINRCQTLDLTADVPLHEEAGEYRRPVDQGRLLRKRGPRATVHKQGVKADSLPLTAAALPPYDASLQPNRTREPGTVAVDGSPKRKRLWLGEGSLDLEGDSTARYPKRKRLRSCWNGNPLAG